MGDAGLVKGEVGAGDAVVVFECALVWLARGDVDGWGVGEVWGVDTLLCLLKGYACGSPGSDICGVGFRCM